MKCTLNWSANHHFDFVLTAGISAHVVESEQGGSQWTGWMRSKKELFRSNSKVDDQVMLIPSHHSSGAISGWMHWRWI